MTRSRESFGARFGALVLRRRTIEGLTQEALAAKAFPGGESSKSRISELESGHVANPQAKTVDALVVALNLSEDEVEACRDPGPAVAEKLAAALFEQRQAFQAHTDSVAEMLTLLRNGALVARVEARGLSPVQLENLLRKFGHAGAPIEEAEKLLLDAAEQLRIVREQLARLSNADPDVQRLKSDALVAIECADLDRARALLTAAAKRDMEAVREIENSRLARRLSASDTLAQIARLSSAEASFIDAAEQFGRAARIAEPVDVEIAWWHWIDAATAHSRSAEVFPNIKASRAAVAVVRRHNLPLAIQSNDPVKVQRARFELAENLSALASRVPEEEALELWKEALAESSRALKGLAPDASAGLRATGWAQQAAILLALGKITAGSPGTSALRDAAAAYESALKFAETHIDGLLVPGLYGDLATALRALSERTTEPESSQLLDRAIALHRKGIELLLPAAEPSALVEASNNLGVALLTAADRAGANLSAEYFQSAIAAFDASIEAIDPQLNPLAWARSTANRAIAGRRLASVTPGSEGERDLRHAIARHEGALSAYSPDETPREWAQSHNNLGVARLMLALRVPDDQAVALLESAGAAFELALATRAGIGSAGEANALDNLGLVYRHLASRSEGAGALARLHQSRDAHSKALALRSPASEPSDWGSANANLALTEALLAEATSDLDLAQQALERIDRSIALFADENLAGQLAEARRLRTLMSADSA